MGDLKDGIDALSAGPSFNMVLPTVSDPSPSFEKASMNQKSEIFQTASEVAAAAMRGHPR